MAVVRIVGLLCNCQFQLLFIFPSHYWLTCSSNGFTCSFDPGLHPYTVIDVCPLWLHLYFTQTHNCFPCSRMPFLINASTPNYCYLPPTFLNVLLNSCCFNFPQTLLLNSLNLASIVCIQLKQLYFLTSESSLWLHPHFWVQCLLLCFHLSWSFCSMLMLLITLPLCHSLSLW